ncbi:MAG: general secretion pathway protein B [Alteromonadaceae bacterium]|jgi:general secretion pathway protein B
MSYLLDALNKSSGENAPRDGSPASPPMMYHPAAFDQDEGVNIYKWVSIVLALVLTLILGIVLGNQLSIVPANTALVAQVPVTQAPIATPAQQSLTTPVITPTVVAATPPPLTVAKVSQQPPEQIMVGYIPPTDDNQLVVTAKRTKSDPANPPRLDNISSDLLEKFSAAVKQSKDNNNADKLEDILKSEEFDSQYLSNVDRITDLSLAVQITIPDLIYEAHIFSTAPDQRWVKINNKTIQEHQWIDDTIEVIEIQQQFVILEMQHVRFSLAALTDWHSPTP